jgi:hypothetical protein
LLAYGWWFSPGTPASTTKTGRHDIAEILLKVALNTNNPNPIHIASTSVILSLYLICADLGSVPYS